MLINFIIAILHEVRTEVSTEGRNGGRKDGREGGREGGGKEGGREELGKKEMKEHVYLTIRQYYYTTLIYKISIVRRLSLRLI